MKIMHFSIIGVMAVIVIITGVMILPSMLNTSNLTSNKKPHDLPNLPNIVLLFNGTGSDQHPLVPFEIKQGQNATILLDVISDPRHIPVTLGTQSHVGFTKTNGIDLRLSSTKITTPDMVLLYISTSKDATPNKYQILVEANTTAGMGVSLYYHFNIIVKP